MSTSDSVSESPSPGPPSPSSSTSTASVQEDLLPASPADRSVHRTGSSPQEDTAICQWDGCNCGIAFDRLTLFNHLKDDHIGVQKSRYTCEWASCSVRQASRRALVSHLRWHIGDRPFTCPDCGLVFARSDSVARHMRMRHISASDHLQDATSRRRTLLTLLNSLDKLKEDDGRGGLEPEQQPSFEDDRDVPSVDEHLQKVGAEPFDKFPKNPGLQAVHADILYEQRDTCDAEATATAHSNLSCASATSSSKSTGSQDFPTRPWQSLNPTLSSWKKLMKRLSTAISHVEELAGTAPAEHQPSLQAQIAELHDALKRHQDRYEEFVKLSQEYAEQYLRDLSDEIRSQSAWLVLLERRLELAKTLRTDALDLKASFEKGVCKELKGVRAAVRACPLADESDLLKELDTLIGAIKACYVELDKFWADEVRHVTQALKEHRTEPGEVDRWRKLQINLEGILEGGTKGTPASETLPSPRFLDLAVKPTHQLDVPAVAVTLIPAIHAIQTSLSSARGFNRPIFSALKPKHLQSLQKAHYNVAQHNSRCMRFLGDCVAYARKATESACAATGPTFARITAAFGLRKRATALTHAHPLAGSVDVPKTAGKKVCKAFHELGNMLRDGERLWRAIVDADTHVFAALVWGEESRSVVGCSTKQLTKLLRRMDKEKSVLQRLSLASW